MNLTDFIHSLPITNETYDHTIENGLTKTITHMITNGLSNCYKISSSEFMKLLAQVKLGVSLNVISLKNESLLDSLLKLAKPPEQKSCILLDPKKTVSLYAQHKIPQHLLLSISEI
mgnify:CR=1 FL=1